jgi:sec-independent protein translocase protein TatC
VKKDVVEEEEAVVPKPKKAKGAVVKAKPADNEIAVPNKSAKTKVVDEEVDDAGPEDDKPMTFWEHLDELRSRLIRSAAVLLVGVGVAWYFKEKVKDAIAAPFCEAWVKHHVEGRCNLTFAAPQAAFTSYLKLAVIGGIGLAAPFIFYQLWGFIAPGLYQKEKRYVIPFAFFSSVLFVGGGWFGYLGAFPFTFGYFLSLAGSGDNSKVAIVPMVTMESYIDFVVQVLLGFGIIFEIPILFTFLAMIGVVNHKMLLKFARYFVLIAFIAAAILTPPDWTSQVVMAIPACALYFGSIGLVYIFEPKATREALKEEAEKEKKAKKAPKKDEE